MVDDFVGTLVVVLAVVEADEVVHIHQELRRGAGTRQLRGDHEHHINKATAERAQLGRGGAVAADRSRAFVEPGIHGDGGAVVGQTGLVVFVDEVVVEQVEVTVSKFLAVYRLDAVRQQAAVDADEARLGQLADERGDIFLLHVGVGVVLRAGGRVGSIAVVAQEVDLLADLAIFGVLLAVQDVVFGHSVVLFRHQGSLHLVLDLLHGDAVGHADTTQDAVEVLVGGIKAGCEKGFTDGYFDLVEGEGFLLAVPFGNVQSSVAHIMCSFSIYCVIKRRI